jgi:hypothetical protein
LPTKLYEARLKDLHVELVKLQQWVVHKGLKVCVIFEGRDGAGKGGTIKALTERVSPRVFRVVALPGPGAFGGLSDQSTACPTGDLALNLPNTEVSGRDAVDGRHEPGGRCVVLT